MNQNCAFSPSLLSGCRLRCILTDRFLANADVVFPPTYLRCRKLGMPLAAAGQLLGRKINVCGPDVGFGLPRGQLADECAGTFSRNSGRRCVYM